MSQTGLSTGRGSSEGVAVLPTTRDGSSRRSRVAVQSAALALSALVLATAAVLHPDPRGYGTHEQAGFPPCTFRRLTGIPCPGCGMTTAFAWTVRLQLGRALSANVFGTLLCLGTAALGALSLICLLTDWGAWRLLGRLASPEVMWGMVALLLASWAIKVLGVLRGWWP